MEGSAERLHNEVGASRPHESPLGTSADRASPQLREGVEHVSVSARGRRACVSECGWPSVAIGGHQAVIRRSSGTTVAIMGEEGGSHL